MKKCSYCAEEIQNEAIKCKHCGSMLELDAVRIVNIPADFPTYEIPKLLPDSFLEVGEKICLELRPAKGPYFAGTIGMVMLFTMSLLFLPANVKPDIAIFIAWSIAGVMALMNFFKWKNIAYALTSRRVIAMQGWLNREIKQAPLEKIKSVEMKKVYAAGNRNLGSITFDVTGSSDKEIVWVHVESPEECHKLVSEIIS